jgi:beta-glucosidase
MPHSKGSKYRFILFALLLLTFFSFPRTSVAQSLTWNEIDTRPENLRFPKNFIWGVAASAYQTEGGDTSSNWYQWEQTKKADGTPRTAKAQLCGASTQHWQVFKEDIQSAKQLGINSFRISLSWSRIQPLGPDSFDENALAHYDSVIDEMKRQNIEPMICLHHFVVPLWFAKKGEWEKKENIQFFKAFAQKVFARYSNRVKLWFPFNEPVVNVLAAYVGADYPPGKPDPKVAGTVLCNILDAHVAVYQALKSMPNGKEAQIGMIHNYSLLEPWRKHNLIDKALAKYGNLLSNETILTPFETGQFKLHIGGVITVNYNNPDIIHCYDFVGVNYYNRYGLHLNLFAKDKNKKVEMNRFPSDSITDMDYGLYPEGLQVAIERMAKLKKPMYITEIGIADDKGPNRALHITRSYYVISQAIQQGYDIRGIYYWSLTDNFEWTFGFDKRFGLYHVDYQTQNRTLKPGSEELRKIIQVNE